MEYKAPVNAADPNASYINGNPSTNTRGSIPPAEAIEHPMREIVHAIEQFGLEPSGADLTQLYQVILRGAGRTVTTVTAAQSPKALGVAESGVVLVDASAGAVALNLPPVSANPGLRYVVIRVDASANSVSVHRAGTDTIDGATSLSIAIDSRWELISDGISNWLSIGERAVAATDVALLGRDHTTIITPFLLAERLRGIPFPWPGEAPPPGAITYHGAELVRADFPELWGWALARNAVVTEAEWQAGMWGLFSSGDGVSTFRTPDLRGEHIRGWDAGRGADPGRAVGSHQDDAIREHHHMVDTSTDYQLGNNRTGARGSATLTQAGGYRTSGVFDGSTHVGDVETRPRNIAYNYCAFY